MSTDRPSFSMRPTTLDDFDAIRELQERCFPGMLPWQREEIVSQLKIFPEGQLCIESAGKIVASASCMIVNKDNINLDHTWIEVTGHGSITTHDPGGDSLYGIEIMVDPEFRGRKLSRQLYDARKAMVRKHNLRRILIGGRMPGYRAVAEQMSPGEYVDKVRRGQLEDPTLLPQIANGFRVLGVLTNYFPSDRESLGHAVLMEWLNPEFTEAVPKPI